MIVPHVDVEQHGSRDDEDEDEVVVNSEPAKVWCPVAGALFAHVPALRDQC